MKQTPFVSVLAVAAVLLSGCGGGQKAAQRGPAPAEPPTPAPGAPNPDGASSAPPKNPLENAKVDVPAIPKKNTEGWASGDKVSPREIAARMDQAMRSLRNVRMVATVVGKTPKGRILPSTFPAEIQDARTFRIHYLRLRDGEPTTGIATANGSKLVELTDGGMSTPRAVAGSPKRDMEKFVEAWPRSFPSDVFDGLIDGGDFWTSLVGAWERGVQGYKLTVEERTTPYQNKQVRNVRFVAERPMPGPGGRVETVELVVDGQIFLPVTIRAHTWGPKGEWEYQWSAEWKNNQKLDASSFKIGRS